MYGCNKLYCEQLGHYYARFYKQLAAEPASGRVDFRCVRFPGLISAVDGAVRRHVRLRARDDSRGGEGGAVRVLRAAGHAHSVHGDARRRRRAAAARRGAARGADAHRLQRRPRSTRQPKRCARSSPARSRRPRSRGTSTRSARASSTPGRRTSTTAPPGATGASPRATTSTRAFSDYLIPTIRERYSRG